MGFAGRSQTQDVCEPLLRRLCTLPFLYVYCPITTISLAGGLLFLQAVHVLFLLPPTFLGRNLRYKGGKRIKFQLTSVSQLRVHEREAAMSTEIMKALLTFWPLPICLPCWHIYLSPLLSSPAYALTYFPSR